MRRRKHPVPPSLRLSLTGSILLAIFLSATKLWSVYQLTVGPSATTYGVPVLFFMFASLAHFSEAFLPDVIRHLTLAVTYSFKLLISATVAIHTHTDLICRAAKSAANTPCGHAESPVDLATALLAFYHCHPISVLLPVLVTLFFLLLGDGLALALEYLSSCLSPEQDP